MMYKYLLSVVIGYLFGSIPSALIIGKTFFNKDIRNYGSGNLGGTNAGRVLGAPIGITVIVMDALKIILAMTITNILFKDINLISIAGFLGCIGHCYPIFANFKGGKAVASCYGYLFGIVLFITSNILNFLVPGIIFLVIVLVCQYVSLGSMVSTLVGGIYLLVKGYTLPGYFVTILALFIIYRHRSNIVRIINHNESKIDLLKGFKK